MHNNYLPFFHSSQWNQRWIHGSRGEISLGKSIKRDRCGFIYNSVLRFKYSITPQNIQVNFVTVANIKDSRVNQNSKTGLIAVIWNPPFCMEPPAWPLRQNHQPWWSCEKETTITTFTCTKDHVCVLSVCHVIAHN